MKFNRINIAKRLIIRKKFKSAKLLLNLLAKQNDAEAQLILGYLYFGGDINTSPEESKYWLKRSAKNGNAEALALLASASFRSGRWNTIADSRKHFLITLNAAKKGSAEAQRSMACIYAHGILVEQDDVKTMYWDERAAKQGLAESQNDLALMLLHGIGGRFDVEKALYWYTQSASKDCNVPYAQEAAEALAGIYSGEPYKELLDLEKKKYWEERGKFLGGLAYRGHPDWFYK